MIFYKIAKYYNTYFKTNVILYSVIISTAYPLLHIHYSVLISTHWVGTRDYSSESPLNILDQRSIIHRVYKNAISDGWSTMVLWVNGIGSDWGLWVGWGVEHHLQSLGQYGSQLKLWVEICLGKHISSPIFWINKLIYGKGAILKSNWKKWIQDCQPLRCAALIALSR